MSNEKRWVITLAGDDMFLFTATESDANGILGCVRDALYTLRNEIEMKEVE